MSQQATPLPIRLGFLGAGAMAEALIRGVTAVKLVRPENILICNRQDGARLEALAAAWGARPCPDRRALAAESDVLVLAVKPKDVPEALAGLAPSMRAGRVLLSVAAGVPTSYLERLVAPGVQVVRAMPNTSCLVQASATALSLGASAGPEAERIARAIFGCVGVVSVVAEPLLDAVTGLSGSGPAYVYFLMEAMIRAGIEEGLQPDVARALTVQTVLGAARMVDETGAEPAELRRRVTSPGGTTMAALQVMYDHHLPDVIVRAIRRAAERSREMGRALVAEHAS